MRKLALPMSVCLAVVLGTLAMSAAEVPAAAPATAHAAGQQGTTITPILLNPQPLPAFLTPADPGTGCAAALLTNPKPLNLSWMACMRRLDCPPCGFGCVKDCDGFGCCVCYCK